MRKFNLSILFLFIFGLFFHSCSDDNLLNEGEFDTNVSKMSEYYKSPEFFVKSIDIISNNLIENTVSYRGSSTYELTQADLDEYIQISGYNGPVPALADVNYMINTLVDTYQDDGGFHFPIERDGIPPMSERTNSLFTEMLTNGSIPNLQVREDFIQVIPTEQEILMYVNNILAAWENGEIDFGDNGGIAGRIGCSVDGYSSPCFVVGAMAGFALGNGICGSMCGVVGGVIGGVIGGLAGAS